MPIMEDPVAVLTDSVKGGERVICPLVKLDARLEHKLKSLAKYHGICESLKQDIRVIESEKRYLYSHLMNKREVY